MSCKGEDGIRMHISRAQNNNISIKAYGKRINKMIGPAILRAKHDET
jgi:hypothetical protein